MSKTKKAIKGKEKVENGVVLGNKETKKGNNKVEKVSSKTISPKRLKLINDTIKELIANPTKRATAKALGISEQALFKRFKLYPQILKGVEGYLDSVKNDARRKIDLRSVTSVDRVIEYADNAKSEGVGLQANLELLDRAGIVKPSNNTNNIQVNVLNDLKKLKSEYD